MTHGDSLRYAFLPRMIPLPGSGKGYYSFLTPFEDRALVESFNAVLSRIFGGEGKKTPYVGEFMRNKGELTLSILRGESRKLLSELKKIQEHEREFTVEMGNGIFKMLTPQENVNGVKIKIVTRYDWKSQEVAAHEFE